MNVKTYNNIVKNYADRIFTYLLKSLKDYNLSEDLTQDTFVELWKHRKKINPESVKPWLYTTAYRKMLNHYRKHSKEQLGIDGIPIIIEADCSRTMENQDLLNKAFLRLKPEQKSLILLKSIEGYNYKEIAEICDLPEKKVKDRLFKARQKLKKVVKELLTINSDQYEQRSTG